MKRMKKIFTIYCMLLVLLLVFKDTLSWNEIVDKIESTKWSREMGAWNINLVPFRTIGEQMARMDNIWAAKNIIGNIVLFMPFGILLPMSFQKVRRFIQVWGIGIVFIVGIETLQFVSMLGSFDVDDVILNSFGIVCGYICGKIIQRRFKGDFKCC